MNSSLSLDAAFVYPKVIRHIMPQALRSAPAAESVELGETQETQDRLGIRRGGKIPPELPRGLMEVDEIPEEIWIHT